MLENTSISQHQRFRDAVRVHCPYQNNMCDGRPIIRDGKRKAPCPFKIDGLCRNSEIAKIRDEIYLEIEKRKSIK